MQERKRQVDLCRGILIILVVFGHYQGDLLHDIIFLFHMPLFFMLSGFLLNCDKLTSFQYLKTRSISLLIPYAVYLLLDWLVIRRDYSVRSIARLIWGGRALSGTYWYITCFIAALFLFSFLLRCFSDKTVKCLTILGGVSVIESHLSERIEILLSPGIPWNIDVALFAVVYLAIGFCCKKKIRRWLEEDNKNFDIVAVIISLFLVAFCVFNYWGGRRLYYFDMKPLYYKELLSAALIPCAFGVVLCRAVFWIERIKGLSWVATFFTLLGRMTIPIMFMHVPLNTWKEQLGYGRIVYVLIGVGVPVIFTVVFHQFRIMRKLFGLPEIIGSGRIKKAESKTGGL